MAADRPHALGHVVGVPLSPFFDRVERVRPAVQTDPVRDAFETVAREPREYIFSPGGSGPSVRTVPTSDVSASRSRTWVTVSDDLDDVPGCAVAHIDQ